MRIANLTRSLSSALLSAFAVAVALIIGALLMQLTGSSAVDAYRELWDGAFGTTDALAETLVYSTPLMLGGLAFSLAARAGMFNIGVEGQLVVGGFCAALAGAWDLGLPTAVYVPFALLCGAIGGGLWGLLPGALKAKTGAHEVITTIMLNYLAFSLIRWLTLTKDNVLPVQPQNVATKRVAAAARLPKVLDGTRLHIGIIIAIVAAILIWLMLYHTRFGYNIRAVGLSRGASAYGSIHWGWTISAAMMLAGAIAGLAGAGESLGLHGRAYIDPPGYGFTSIAVGLVARNNPIGVIFSGMLFGALSAGGQSMQNADVSKEIVAVIQGLIILAVAALDVLQRVPALRARLGRTGRVMSTTSTDPASNQPGGAA